MELRAKRKIDVGPIKETLTFRLFLFIGFLMVACSLLEFFLRSKTLQWPTFAAGWAVALLAFYIRRQAIAALGRFWSLHVEIREHHQLVQTGPFRWMRHPAYFSMVLELLAVGLMLNAFFSLLILPCLFVPALILRLRLEETALIEKFGDVYRAYQKSTPALFPYRGPCVSKNQ